MRLRRQFDEAELAAIREFDAAMGGTGVKVAVPVDAYRHQLATREFGQQQWTPEQKRRAASAWPIRLKKVDAAEVRLTEQTLAILKRFGFRENHLPPVRRRKWDGPAVIGFNGPGGGNSPESRALLREVHRLWNLSGRQQP